MNKKEFIVILLFSVVVWFLSTIFKALLNFQIDLYGPSRMTIETGYPLAYEVNADSFMRFIYYAINITFWFIITSLFWKFILKRSKK